MKRTLLTWTGIGLLVIGCFAATSGMATQREAGLPNMNAEATTQAIANLSQQIQSLSGQLREMRQVFVLVSKLREHLADEQRWAASLRIELSEIQEEIHRTQDTEPMEREIKVIETEVTKAETALRPQLEELLRSLRRSLEVKKEEMVAELSRHQARLLEKQRQLNETEERVRGIESEMERLANEPIPTK